MYAIAEACEDVTTWPDVAALGLAVILVLGIVWLCTR